MEQGRPHRCFRPHSVVPLLPQAPDSLMVHLHFSVRGICALLSVVGSVITSRIIASQVYCYNTHHRMLFFEVTEPMATPVSC